MGKGEIARYEQFLLSPQFFQKACFPGGQKVSLCGNGFTGSFYDRSKTRWAFENNVGKAGNTSHRHSFHFRISERGDVSLKWKI